MRRITKTVLQRLSIKELKNLRDILFIEGYGNKVTHVLVPWSVYDNMQEQLRNYANSVLPHLR